MTPSTTTSPSRNRRQGHVQAGDPVQASKDLKDGFASATTRLKQPPDPSPGGGAARRVYVIEAGDLDEASSYAAKCPAASVGAVEVRPIFSM